MHDFDDRDASNRFVQHQPAKKLRGGQGVEDVSFTETLARAHLKKHISLDPQVGNETKRIGQRTDVYTVPTPQRSRRLEGRGGSVTRIA